MKENFIRIFVAKHTCIEYEKPRERIRTRADSYDTSVRSERVYDRTGKGSLAYLGGSFATRTTRVWSNFPNRGASFAFTRSQSSPPFLSEFLWIPLAPRQWLKFHSFRIVRAVSRTTSVLPLPRSVICAYRPRCDPLFRAPCKSIRDSQEFSPTFRLRETLRLKSLRTSSTQ